jgi:hypothetical protein
VAAFVLLAGAAAVVAVALAPRKDTSKALAGADTRQDGKDESNERASRRDEERPRGGGDVPRGEDPVKREPVETALPNSLSEEEQREVNEAIERGVAYLRKHAPAGAMGNQRQPGLHPLVGLTLLECGVSPDDPTLASLIGAIRAGARKLIETYSLSLTILFLDRLGDSEDEKLIALLAARLIAGQNDAGGWTYGCPALSEADGRMLLSYLDSHPVPAQVRQQGGGMPLVVRGSDRGNGGGNEPGSGDRPLSRADLPASVKDRPVVAHDFSAKVPRGAGDDNSNTQFAILGVWAARRHRITVDRSLALISARFHQSQNGDGSWGYNLHSMVRRDSMTCAGLLGLAVARASDAEGDAAEKDPAIAKGLKFLGQKVQNPGGVRKPRRGRANFIGLRADSLGDLYWLWSLERVGVIYSLHTIGGKDWYAWGAGVIVEHQNDDGSWQGGQGPVVDTCFALLFLKRVNVAKDLTRQLQLIGPVRDPGLSRDEKEK